MATQTVEAVDHKLLAAGDWVETGEWAEVRSPYDGTPVGRVAQGDAALVDRAARKAWLEARGYRVITMDVADVEGDVTAELDRLESSFQEPR